MTDSPSASRHCQRWLNQQARWQEAGRDGFNPDHYRVEPIPGKHTCLQGPLCHRWYQDAAPIDGCGHRTCWSIVNDVATCHPCLAST